jgi:hypothetical protein
MQLEMEGKKYFDDVTWFTFFLLFAVVSILVRIMYVMQQKKIVEIFDVRAQQAQWGNLRSMKVHLAPTHSL